MDIIDFVRERAAEDAVLCRAADPVDVDLLYASHIAERLVQVCGGHYDRLTPRQRQVLRQLAERHRSHDDFNPIWCLEEHPPGTQRPAAG